MVENGWEVGVHFGIRGHSVEAYREACMRLADLCAAPIQGSRAHYWAGVWNEPLSAWRAMDAAGVRYDASCSPQALGYRGGTMLPTLPSAGWRHGLDDGFVVLATAVMDAYAIPRTAVLGRDTIKDALARIIKNTKSGGLVVLDWHERALANVGAWRGFMQPLLELVVCLAADSACRFLSAAETARMWREHVSRCYVAAVPGELFL